MKKQKTILSILAFLFVSHSAQAYLTFLESGELVPANHYRIGFVPQLITNDTAGTNFDATLDAGWNDSMSSRYLIGAGKMDLHLGGTFKWVPYPDVDKQPAIGMRASVWYARYRDESYLTTSVAPLVSKKVQTPDGLFSPYVALPFNYTLNRNSNFVSQQFIVGSEFSTPRAENMTFAAELGLNLKDSYSFIALYFGYQFDGSKGLPLK